MRVKQGFLRASGVRDVGLGRAGTNGDAVADARNIDGWSGREMGLGSGVLEHIDGHHDQIEGRA